MIRDLEAQETMRLSRVPVSSLDRHALVYDSGGLRNDSPWASFRILRSSGLKLSAIRAARTQASVPRFSRAPSGDGGWVHVDTHFGAQYRAC